MIGRFVQHTQGGTPMKGDTDRRHRRNWRIGTLAVLLPLALGSTAQTTLQGSTAAPPRPAAVVSATATVTAPTVTRALPPLPTSFNVQEFESVAQSMVADQRVPGMAMAIVRNGQILSLHGYGVADVSSGDPIGAHTVFRLASLSKAFFQAFRAVTRPL